jgi:hypothetical protein
VYVLALIDYPTATVLCFSGGVLHLVDVILRKLSGRNAEIISAVRGAEALLTRIDIAVPSFKGEVEMGQFLVVLCLFSFSAVSLLYIPALEAGPIEQIHPFTIAHYGEERRVAPLFVRDVGRDTFRAWWRGVCSCCRSWSCAWRGPTARCS